MAVLQVKPQNGAALMQAELAGDPRAVHHHTCFMHRMLLIAAHNQESDQLGTNCIE